MSVDPTAAAPSAALVPQPVATSGVDFEFRLANLNPLQYLPIIGTIYRAITGEHIDPGWRIGGAVVTGALIGGPAGIVTSLLGVGFEELFHRIIGDAEPAGPTPDPATRRQAVAAYEATAMLDSQPWVVAEGSG